MTKHFQREIDAVKKKVLALSAIVEESVHKSVRSIIERDQKLAASVVEQDEAIDAMEVEVEEDCLKILALHQPVAIDLRFLVAVMKITNDLERIGDLSVNIAERARALACQPKVPISFDIGKMAVITQRMLKKCLDSLVNMDAGLAHQVGGDDDEVDTLHRNSYNKVKEGVLRYPDQVDGLIQMMTVSRYLERIADHATNIAEDVIYMIDGEIVRHKMGNGQAPK